MEIRISLRLVGQIVTVVTICLIKILSFASTLFLLYSLEYNISFVLLIVN